MASVVVGSTFSPNGNIAHYLSRYESFHHRVAQSITEFNQFEIKRIELRDTLCYSVVKTPFFSVMNLFQLLIRMISLHV